MNELYNQELEELQSLTDSEGQIEGFVIDDINKLNWTFRKIAAMKKKIHEVEAIEKAELERIKNWANKQKEKHKRSIEFFEEKVFGYHAYELLKDPKLKTISTPYGKVKSRSNKASVEKLDEKQLLQHVIANELPYTKSQLDWSELKKNLRIDENTGRVYDEIGQEVLGVSVKEAGTSFSIEVKI